VKIRTFKQEVSVKKTIQNLINDGTPADHSLILRYHAILPKILPDGAVTNEDLTMSSLAEGARIFPLAQYRGVDIWACDESSLMATGTYKDLDACLMAAIARHTGLGSIVLSSGGNLGYAMARYAQKAGLKVYFFHPKSTLYKLDAANFDDEGVKVITVDRPEPEVKSLALNFAKTYCIEHVPDVEWRYAASTVRAMHIAENLLSSGNQVDWLAQAICAGYGPVGIYDCWSGLIDEGILPSDVVPPFLGIQQASNAPIVRAWQAGALEITRQLTQGASPDKLIEPGMYNTNPNNNYSNLLNTIERYGGDFIAIDGDDYKSHEDTVTGWFRDSGLEFTINPQSGEILERAGIMTGIGIMNAVDQGHIKKGNRVLYLLTGGFRKLSSFSPLQPDLEVTSSQSINGWVRELGSILDL